MPSISTKTIGEMKEVAYQPEDISLVGTEAAYWVVRDPGRNLTIFSSYHLGGSEFPKTYGHFHEPAGEETYQVIFGKAGLLMQWSEGTVASKIQLKVLYTGEKFTVPAGAGHALINLGDSYLVTLDDHDPSKMTNVYEDVKKTHGFGWYICDVEGIEELQAMQEEESGLSHIKLVAIPNPNFKDLPPLQKI